MIFRRTRTSGSSKSWSMATRRLTTSCSKRYWKAIHLNTLMTVAVPESMGSGGGVSGSDHWLARCSVWSTKWRFDVVSVWIPQKSTWQKLHCGYLHGLFHSLLPSRAYAPIEAPARKIQQIHRNPSMPIHFAGGHDQTGIARRRVWRDNLDQEGFPVWVLEDGFNTTASEYEGKRSAEGMVQWHAKCASSSWEGHF